MRILPFLVINCLLVSQSWAAGTTTIAAFGDSLFAGYGLNAPEAFPIRLEQKLTADGYNVKVINMGISGDTTSGGLARIETVIAQKPDIVILELGGNDMLRAMPPAATLGNLDAILQKLKASGAKVVLTGHIAPLNYGKKYADDYNAIFPALAAKYGIPLYPAIMQGLIGHPDLLQQDGIHPTAKGVETMVSGITPTITKLLRK